MGACNFYDTFECTDYREGFRILSERARDEYGYDPYSGTIATTSLRGIPHEIAERYTASADKKAIKYADEHIYRCEKRDAYVLDLGVTGYEVSSFKKVPHTSATVVYQTFYVAYADDRVLGQYKTAAEARKRVEKELARPDFSVSRYHVEKESRPATKGCETCSFAYEQETRRTKTKPKSAPKGATVRAIHKWAYYGWAAC